MKIGLGLPIADAAIITPAALKTQLRQLESLGADDAVLYCWSPNPDQVHHLADLLP
ncbi:hypothetical protein [Saccharopolyspora sp. NPDC002686]|uniref:hypothetical protein n=1 Tax=Saccharopolyspora sp. NPDC002686 TaxID=3154541 RepID=UPI003318DFF7